MSKLKIKIEYDYHFRDMDIEVFVEDDVVDRINAEITKILAEAMETQKESADE